MNLLETTLAKFRDCFRSLFPYNTDAAIELVDSLSANTNADSVVQLSESSEYSRHYTTITSAVSSFHKPRDENAEDYITERQEAIKKIQNTLCQHIEIEQDLNYHLFAIDVTPNPRPYAKKLKGKGFIKMNEVVKSSTPVTIGHNYSCVAYLTGDTRWVLPVAMDRVPVQEKETVFGVRQWCEIIADKNNQFDSKNCVGVFDSAYSNAYAIAEFVKHDVKDAIFISRLRADRVLQRPYTGVQTGKKGHPVYFDKENPFELKNEDSLGTPDYKENCQWETKRGKVHTVSLKGWKNLRMRGHNDAPIQAVPMMAIKITVTNQNNELVYKRPLWLIVVGDWPHDWSITESWYSYNHRFDLEHYFRFGKNRLLLSNYQSPKVLNEENWKQFCMISTHQLYHARNLVPNLKKTMGNSKGACQSNFITNKSSKRRLIIIKAIA